MKKLMIAAVAMASTVALANTQVYDVKINLKTTACKKTTLRANQNPFHANAGDIQYRDPATLTLQGLIWACDCDYIEDLGQSMPVGAAHLNWKWYRFASTTTYGGARQSATSGSEGYVFWNAKTRAPWGYATITKPQATADNATTWTIARGEPMPTLNWALLQRIGSRAEKVEGVWTLVDNYSGTTQYNLTGAGFGSARVGTVATTLDNAGIGAQAAAAVNGLNECAEAIITSISGNVAGWILPTSTDADCVFCGTDAACTPWPFCNCTVNHGYQPVRTAAYGTWSMKYNASLSRRLLQHASIRDIYSFSDATADVVRLLEANTL